MIDDKTIAKAFSTIEKRFNRVLHTETAWKNSPEYKCVCSIEKQEQEGNTILSLLFSSRTTFSNVVNIDGKQKTPIEVRFKCKKWMTTFRMLRSSELKAKFKRIWVENAIGKNVFIFEHKVLDENESIESLAIEHDMH